MAGKGVPQSQILWIVIVFFLFIVLIAVAFLFFGYLTQWFYRRRLLEQIRALNEAQKTAKDQESMMDLQSKIFALVAQLQQANSREITRLSCQGVQLNKFKEPFGTGTKESIQSRNQLPSSSDAFKEMPRKNTSKTPPPHPKKSPPKTKPRLYCVDETSNKMSDSKSGASKPNSRKRQHASNPITPGKETETTTNPSQSASTNVTTGSEISQSNLTTDTNTPRTPSNTNLYASKNEAGNNADESSKEEVLFDDFDASPPRAKKFKSTRRLIPESRLMKKHDSDSERSGRDDYGEGSVNHLFANNANNRETPIDEVVLDDFLDELESPRNTIVEKKQEDDSTAVNKRGPANKKPSGSNSDQTTRNSQTAMLKSDKTQSDSNRGSDPTNSKTVHKILEGIAENDEELSDKRSSPKETDSPPMTFKTKSIDDSQVSLNPYWRAETECTTDYSHILSPNTGRLQKIAVKARENTIWYPPSTVREMQPSSSTRPPSRLANSLAPESFILPQKHMAKFYQISRYS